MDTVIVGPSVLDIIKELHLKGSFYLILSVMKKKDFE